MIFFISYVFEVYDTQLSHYADKLLYIALRWKNLRLTSFLEYYCKYKKLTNYYISHKKSSNFSLFSFFTILLKVWRRKCEHPVEIYTRSNFYFIVLSYYAILCKKIVFRQMILCQIALVLKLWIIINFKYIIAEIFD